MKKSILKVICFVLAFVLIFLSVSSLLRYKYQDSITSIERFYEQPDNSIDVLCLGSSHIYEGISPAVLYREYGIAAYDLCAPAQSVWSSYHYFVEALKTQAPKAVIFDVYMLNTNGIYDSVAGAIKSTYGMKWSKNKIENMKASFPEDSYDTLKIPFYQYHSRYGELNAEDVLINNGNKIYFGKNYKGFVTSSNVYNAEEPDITGITDTRTFSEKTEEYYRKIIELAIENNINLYVISVPYILDKYNQTTANTAGKIVEEYNNDLVRYIDFNRLYKEINLDFLNDFSGKQHLNYYGAVKFTSFLGDILKTDLTDLPDRRNDEVYLTWEENANIFYRLYSNCNLQRIKELPEYVDAVFSLDDDYFVLLVKNTEITDNIIEFSKQQNDGAAVEDDTSLTEEEREQRDSQRTKKLEENGNLYFVSDYIGLSDYYDRGAVWTISGGKLELFDSADNGIRLYKSFNRLSDLAVESHEISTADGYKLLTEIKFNDSNYTYTENGFCFFIFDLKTESFVDAVAFNDMFYPGSRKK